MAVLEYPYANKAINLNICGIYLIASVKFFVTLGQDKSDGTPFNKLLSSYFGKPAYACADFRAYRPRFYSDDGKSQTKDPLKINCTPAVPCNLARPEMSSKRPAARTLLGAPLLQRKSKTFFCFCFQKERR